MPNEPMCTSKAIRVQASTYGWTIELSDKYPANVPLGVLNLANITVLSSDQYNPCLM